MKLKLIGLMFFLIGISNLNAQWTDEQKRIASDNVEGDNFGNSVAVSGDYAIVGAKYNDDNGADSGAAYIFERSLSGNWIQQQKLVASDAGEFHRFGESVAISGDLVIIGAPVNNAVYVFERGADGNWTEVQKLISSDAPRGNLFGDSVSISGDVAVVGAFRDNGSTGAAYVFEKGSDGSWFEVKKLTASDAFDSDGFGISVSVSGDLAIIGAFLDDDNGISSGSAYIFERGPDTWIESKKLIPNDGGRYDNFGQSVAISADVAVVGARGKDGFGTDTGAVYIFEKGIDGSWGEIQMLRGFVEDQLGNSVAVSDNVAVVGSFLNDEEAGDSGSAYMIRKGANGLWEDIQKVNASDAAYNDRFGWSVAISGDVAIIGAAFSNENGEDSGSAYFYRYTPTTNQAPSLTALGTLNVEENSMVILRGDITATDDTDTEGNGLSYAFSTKYGYGEDNTLFILTEDTGVLSFINSPDFENPLDKGNDNLYEVQVTVTDSGGFYAFQNYPIRVTDVNETIWGNVQKVLTSVSGEGFGNSVSISNDFAIIGASGNDDLSDEYGRDSGSAYIYQRDTNCNWIEVQKIFASDGTSYDYFGTSVAISGNTAIVGANGNDDNGSNSGSVYIYEKRADGTWIESQKLTASNATSESNFGTSVAISGNFAVVGTHYDSKMGLAYVFEKRVDGSWVELQMLAGSDTALREDFGKSVFMSGDNIIIGAEDNDTNGSGSGAAYIFEKSSNGTWVASQKLTASDASLGDGFGSSAAISDNVAIVGAWSNNDDGENSGSAYIFEKSPTGNWVEVEKLKASDASRNGFFGISVGIYGDIAIIGSDEDATKKGAAYLFEKQSSGNWVETQKFTPFDGSGYDFFSRNVSIFGNTVIIGAKNDNESGSHSGAVYFYGCAPNDTTSPIIVLNGANPLELNLGDIFIEPGFLATDNVDGVISDRVVVDTSDLNTNATGTYGITYNVSDASGNAAVEVIRTINVSSAPNDTTSPIIILNGANPLELNLGDIFIEPGFLATDNVDGEISDRVVVDTSDLNTNATGTYGITYNVSDVSGNAAVEVIRTIKVSGSTNKSKLYPSPTSDWFNVSGFDKDGNVEISITDLSGKVVKNLKRSIVNGFLKINVSDISSTGVYILSIYQDEKERVDFKVVIE